VTLPDSTVRGRGVVASVDALASSAGAALLRAGGSAADAAVGASAVLAVTTQHMCGMGGDLVAMVHPGGVAAPRALLAVGRAGSGASAGQLRAEGLTSVPLRGDLCAVTVPGCVDGWLALHAAHGRLPLADVLAPAVGLAEDGFPISPLLAAALPRVADVPGAGELVGSLPAAAGDVRHRPGVARALRAIAAEGRSGWYGGEFGAGLLALAGRLRPGLFTADDLTTDLAEWAQPLTVPSPGGGSLLAPPAPSQAYLVLAARRIVELVGDVPDPEDPRWPHLVVEASRAAGRDRVALLHDGADLGRVLHPAELRRRAALVDPRVAATEGPPTHGGGTIYLCAVDSDGMAVSLSQSNAAGFGAHLVVPEVGVFLQDRGLGFSLHPESPAELGPGRRPPHTLAPVLAVGADGRARVVAGTMGGDAQPQIVLQLLLRLAAGQTPAAAVAAPRVALAGPLGTGFDTWEAGPGGFPSVPTVRVEAGAPAGWVTGLRRLGHVVETAPSGGGFGHAQLAVLAGAGAGAGAGAAHGTVAAAADPRAGTGAAVPV